MLDILPYYALVGGVAGAVLSAYYDGAMAAALMLACGCTMELYKRPERKAKLIMLIGAQLAVMPFYGMGSLAECAYELCGIGISVLCCALLCRAGRALIAPRRLTELEQTLVCVLITLIAMSPGRADVLGVRLTCVLCALGALCAVRARGIYGLVAAVLLSAGCMLTLGEVSAAGGLALCALCAAPFYKNRFGCAAAFCISAAICALAIGGKSLTYIECALAAGIGTALPERVFLRFREAAQTRPRRAAVLHRQRARARELAQVLDRLASLQDGLCALQLSGAAAAMRSICGEADKPRLKLDTGAAARPKCGGTVTGDSMAMRGVYAGMLIALSDGMGSGAAAHDESAAALALLGDLLAVGFELDTALMCVNRLLIRRDGSDMYATLDAAMIDLSTGCTRFIKHGAPQSYVYSGERLQRISAETLPVGIIESARPALHELTLSPGDALVMLTDGVSDALGDELDSAVLDCLAAQDAKSAAWELVNLARQKSEDDDISVIVAKIYC